MTTDEIIKRLKMSAPQEKIRLCNVADDGTVNAHEGDAMYKTNGTNGQVMVEIPNCYFPDNKIFEVK